MLILLYTVNENELYSKIVHKLLATNQLQFDRIQIHEKPYQMNSKTINRINENCFSVQVVSSSKTVLKNLCRFLTLEFFFKTRLM